jgi:hypothetical protein
MATTAAFFDGEECITPHHPMAPRSHLFHFRRRKVGGLVPALRAVMHLGIWMGGAVLALLAASDAFAAEGAPSGPSEAIFFAQIGLLLVVGRLLGEAMQRIGQPAVMGQLVAGMVLGPSVLGALWPDLQHAIFPKSAEQKSMIDAVSQLGIRRHCHALPRGVGARFSSPQTDRATHGCELADKLVAKNGHPRRGEVCYNLWLWTDRSQWSGGARG